MKLATFKNQEIPEATKIGIEHGEKKAQEKLGVYIGNSEVTDLPGTIAGQYHLGTKEKKFDEDFLITQTSNRVMHVILHESYHQANKERGDDQLISDVGVEEALTELATAEISGKTIAYQREIDQLRLNASREALSIFSLVELYKQGQNAKINNLLNLTEDASNSSN